MARTPITWRRATTSSTHLNQPAPEPWAESDHLPWDEPGFSERMLAEHLSQEHDMASRRSEVVDRHVQWIASIALPERTSRILDLGCGPGLYLQRLASNGHMCMGIDYSPASIAYARTAAQEAGLDIGYVCEDVRTAEFGAGLDLIYMIWGELNALPPADAKALVNKCCAALADGGKLLLEVHTLDAIQRLGNRPGSSQTHETGLFHPGPHTIVEESFWNAELRAATVRWTATDSAAGEDTVYAASYQAYTEQEYDHLLTEAGLAVTKKADCLSDRAADRSEDLTVLIAERLPGSPG